jgi:hypothetical protein
MADLTGQQARAVNSPWYSLFSIATRGDVRAVQDTVLTEDYESCAGYLPGQCGGPRDIDQGGLELREHDPGHEIRDQGKCWSPAIT